MNKLRIQAYVWEKEYDPNSCRECDLFCRCGVCVPSGEKVSENWDDQTKPDWCPLRKETV